MPMCVNSVEGMHIHAISILPCYLVSGVWALSVGLARRTASPYKFYHRECLPFLQCAESLHSHDRSSKNGITIGLHIAYGIVGFPLCAVGWSRWWWCGGFCSGMARVFEV